MLSSRRLCWAVLAVWAVTAIVTLAIAWPRFAPLTLRDPDDAMRLLQVRDFLAGQGWFDVSQHRVNPPIGGPMHWSRLVDLPIAALILLFQPLGRGLAERIALGIEPLLLMGALFAMTALHVRRVADRLTALLAAALLAVSVPILIQFLPLRIDHHGWQILMMAIALWASFDPRPMRGGAIAGAAMANWFHISSEGLPYLLLFGGLYGLRWLYQPGEGLRLAMFAGTLAAGSALLLLATRGFAESLMSYCDAMSPAYLVPLLAVALILAAGQRLAARPWPWRLGVMTVAAGVGGLLFLRGGGSCLAGPFATLDPLVYRYWYLQVMEGRPIWEQPAVMAGVILLPSVAGMAGAAWAARTSRGAERVRWIELLLLMAGALAVAMMVMRSMGMAHLAALPGNGWLLIRLYRPISAAARPVIRVAGSVGLIALTPLGLATAAAMATPDTGAREQADDAAFAACNSATGLGTLNRLTPSTIFAPLDMSPNILLFTPHAVIGTSHHRNKAGMEAVIGAFMARPDKARTILAGARAHYLAHCPGMNELNKYGRAAPDSLAASLLSGRPPGWLRPLPTDSTLQLYAVSD